MLPPPTISFTIPSIHDDLPLQCRVYHPTCLAPTTLSHLTEWHKKAAIVAHPYAPLGGCYDDPVVDIVASTILKQGFVVGTFNFRCVLSFLCHRPWTYADTMGHEEVQVLQRGGHLGRQRLSKWTTSRWLDSWFTICITSPFHIYHRISRSSLALTPASTTSHLSHRKLFPLLAPAMLDIPLPKSAVPRPALPRSLPRKKGYIHRTPDHGFS